jgi:four helix bundle protein
MDKPHKKLDVWRLSMELSRMTYRCTANYPDEEKFGLVSQMRRAAISVPSNLTEGAARSSSNEFRHFVSIARSSLIELDTQFDLSQQLGFITKEARLEVDAVLIRIDKMLYALQRSLKQPREKSREKPRDREIVSS